jgi:erythronate-4-phosphate dehydrogenase
MLVIADENIPYVREAFERVGEVQLFPGRVIENSLLKKADILLVRSVTPVDEELLAGTPIKFVGTVTIGVDHIDLDYLKDKGIGFASAPGSNANSVAEYVVAALLVLADKFQFNLAEKTLAIIGVGNVGRLVLEKVRALGMTVLQNDPPLFRQTKNPAFLPLEVMFKADIITLHVPLTSEGEDKTYHLVDEWFLNRMKRGSFLINTSRGPVVKTEALIECLKNKHLKGAVLDVWEGEPEINLELLKLVTLGTPHIAGYSLDGKVRGVEMIYQAVCQYFQLPSTWHPWPNLPRGEVSFIKAKNENLKEVILKAYNIQADDEKLRKIISYPPTDQGKYFDGLRKNYPVRREFSQIKVEVDKLRLKNILGRLRFQIV